MQRIRYLDQEAVQIVQCGDIAGAVHCYIGKEALTKRLLKPLLLGSLLSFLAASYSISWLI